MFLTEDACQKITELIDNGCEFMLRFDDSEGGENWTADFDNDTARKWTCGCHPTDPSMAVIYAYEDYKNY
jgi:hypothetical protein